LGTTLPQKEAESGNFVPSRDIKTKKIKSLNTIYDLNVGVVERAANFTVNGKATVKDAAFFEGGAVGAIFMPDGTPAIVGDGGLTVTKLNNGKVQVSFTAPVGGIGGGITDARIASIESQLAVLSLTSTQQGSSLTTLGSSLLAVSSSLDVLVGRLNLLEQGSSGGIGSNLAMNISPVGTIDGSNRVFTLPNTPSPVSSLMLFLNGQLLSAGLDGDFTLQGAMLTLAEAPVIDDVILALYSYQTPVTSYSINEPLTVNVTSNAGVQSLSAVLNAAPNPSSSLMVFMNGQLLTGDEDFSLNDRTISFSNTLRDLQVSRFFATYSY